MSQTCGEVANTSECSHPRQCSHATATRALSSRAAGTPRDPYPRRTKIAMTKLSSVVTSWYRLGLLAMAPSPAGFALEMPALSTLIMGAIAGMAGTVAVAVAVFALLLLLALFRRQSAQRVPRARLPCGYECSALVCGRWQLSAGHRDGFDRATALASMAAHRAAGFTSFDMGDIYTGVEALAERVPRGRRPARRGARRRVAPRVPRRPSRSIPSSCRTSS